jgi:hypothetical protein
MPPDPHTGLVESRETHNEVLVAADTAGRSEDWPTLWELRDRLRETDLWIGSYGAACAIAGWYVDRAAAERLLDELIDEGFHQPELFLDEFAVTFALEPGWAEREERMRANVPPPPIELLDWPDYPPTLAPILDRLPEEREAVLRERLPAPDRTSAWATAQQTLAWVTTRWEHANGHVDERDAVAVLDRVDAGERFACVEYTIVLSQALNALGIPARSVNLLMRDHHTGAGRGHVVSEAWIDDLERWVLLDGQNGAWWGDDEPLGVLELVERYARDDRPPMHSRAGLGESEQSVWFWYFATATVTGLTWTDGSFVPTFQTHGAVRVDRLVHGSAQVAPDLATIATGLADAHGPAVRFTPLHPFASGIEVRPVEPTSGRSQQMALDEPFSLRGEPGTHSYEVATVTPYGTLSGSPLRYLTR